MVTGLVFSFQRLIEYLKQHCQPCVILTNERTTDDHNDSIQALP